MHNNNNLSALKCCWKCGGSGQIKVKIRNDNHSHGLINGTRTKVTSKKLNLMNTHVDGMKNLFLSECMICKGSGNHHTLHTKNATNANKNFAPFRNFIPDGLTRGNDIDHTGCGVHEVDLQSTICDGEMLCGLSGQWLIYQRVNGHRYSTDDVCTAYVAIKELDSLEANFKVSHLDLGTGIGSVLLMMAWRFHLFHAPDNHGTVITHSLGVEAQEIHASLARRSIALNGCADTCRVIHADIAKLLDEKDKEPYADIVCKGELFDLVTGTPPYFNLSQGATSLDEARTQCAFECRGGIELYTKVAAARLRKTSSARFVVCETALEVRRVEAAAAVYGLFISRRVDVYGKQGHEKPLFCVFVMRWIRVSEEEAVVSSDDKHADSSSSSSSGGGSSSSSSSSSSNTGGSSRSISSSSSSSTNHGGGSSSGSSNHGNRTEVVSLYVRKDCGCHTSDYDDVMKVLGRPLSSCSCDHHPKDPSTHSNNSKRKAAT